MLVYQRVVCEFWPDIGLFSTAKWYLVAGIRGTEPTGTQFWRSTCGYSPNKTDPAMVCISEFPKNSEFDQEKKNTGVQHLHTHTHHDGPTNGFFTNWNEDFVGPIWICHMTSKRRWAATDKWLSGRTGLTHKLCSLQTLNGVWSSALNFQVNDESICCRRREVQLDSYAPQFCWWSFHICFLRWYEVLLFLLRNTTWTRWMSRGSFYSSSFSRLKSCEIMLPSGNLT